MNTPATATLDRPGATIAYRRVGKGPPLILLHATLSSSRQLRRLAEQLATRFTVISVDRRGSGESALPEGAPLAPIDVSVHIADLVELSASLGLGPALVVGHSYGGCIALELAARHPGVASATWAYEPPYAAVSSASTQAAMQAVAARTAAANEQSGPSAAAEAFMAGVSGPEALAALTPGALKRVQQAGPGAIADAALLGMDPTGIGLIGCPTQITTGSQSPSLYAEIAATLAQRIPGATTTQLEEVGHMAPLLRPDLVADAIKGFTSTALVNA